MELYELVEKALEQVNEGKTDERKWHLESQESYVIASRGFDETHLEVVRWHIGMHKGEVYFYGGDYTITERG